MRTEAIYSELLQPESVTLFAFGRDSKAGRGMGRLYRGKKERLQVCSDWRLLAWRVGRVI